MLSLFLFYIAPVFVYKLALIDNNQCISNNS